MSAADRIEAVARNLQRAEQWYDEAQDLRAIAAELRGAPALTEAERAFFEAALRYFNPQPGDAEDDRFRAAYRAARALRTERTPS